MNDQTEQHRTDQRGDDGFGLIEVMVAMALLMIVALSMLPVMVMALRASATNISVATASQMVSDQMDYARTIPPTCYALQKFVTETVGTYDTDPRGVVLSIDNKLTSACPSTYPGTISLKSTITVQSSGQQLATSETLVFLEWSGVP